MQMKRPKPLRGIKKFVTTHRPGIQEVVREPTAGGIVYRKSAKRPGRVEILLLQDAKGRWTIPKGHFEEGESPRQVAEREIREETGLAEMKVGPWLGKINFRYRRGNSLVLMTTEIYLVEALGKSSDIKPEKWMNAVAWLSETEALDKIEYEDIGKLILLALKKIRSKDRRHN
jgi:ADP-ribose pyrophosphatase YjhB (NUDIX family)